MTTPISSPSVNPMKEFNELLVNEIPIGGIDSLNLIRACYQKMQKLVADYVNPDLERLFELANQGKLNTPECIAIRKKVYLLAQSVLGKAT